ncbi:MAG: sigma-54-dependent Fis family transcriptional regulator [Acidobacteria bacterium]|nr:sigma-54-dependent Fis family transcriptional regulator [Acidobacteriota bacterium]
MKPVPVLVIDDDEAIASTVSVFLRAKGYQVEVVLDGEEALDQVRTGRFPIILSDIYIDRVTGLRVLTEAKNANPSAAVILMTARGSARTTMEAEMGGAFDYLAKPFEMKALLEVVERAQRATAPRPTEPGEDLQCFGGLIGFAPCMVDVYKKMARCARTDDTVLVVGETGCGKELVARSIHEQSARSSKPFAAVDSGAVTGSLWESEIFGALRGAFTGADRDRQGVIDAARGGTVFFDEIGEIPLEFQSKLLRFMQEKEYRPVGSPVARKADVRIITATNRNLESMVRDGKFREDLFYRLNVLRIDVPPLRERRSDIPFLVRRFMEQAAIAAGKQIWLEPDALGALEQFDWPGNVRQLRNTLHRIVAFSLPGPVTEGDVRKELSLPEQSVETEEEDTGALGDLERRHILRVLEQADGNKTRAAEILGIQRRTLYKKLARMERAQSGHAGVPGTLRDQ